MPAARPTSTATGVTGCNVVPSSKPHQAEPHDQGRERRSAGARASSPLPRSPHPDLPSRPRTAGEGRENAASNQCRSTKAATCQLTGQELSLM